MKQTQGIHHAAFPPPCARVPPTVPSCLLALMIPDIPAELFDFPGIGVNTIQSNVRRLRLVRVCQRQVQHSRVARSFFFFFSTGGGVGGRGGGKGRPSQLSTVRSITSPCGGFSATVSSSPSQVIPTFSLGECLTPCFTFWGIRTVRCGLGWSLWDVLAQGNLSHDQSDESRSIGGMIPTS